MVQSDSIVNLIKALAEFNLVVENPKKTAKLAMELRGGGKMTREYAPLDEVLRVLKPAAKFGLVFSQNTVCATTTVSTSTRVYHISGEFIEYDPITVPIVPKEIKKYENGNQSGVEKVITAQEVGVAVSYSRRYSLIIAANIVGEDDDDAESISNDKPAQKPQAQDYRSKGDYQDWVAKKSEQRQQNQASSKQDNPSQPTQLTNQPKSPFFAKIENELGINEAEARKLLAEKFGKLMPANQDEYFTYLKSTLN